jgi:selenocysteine lyase/cysteine desulfurase
MKQDFKLFSGIYADSAASALKPDIILNTELDFVNNYYANSGRGLCYRAMRTDKMVDDARISVAEFMNAAPEQIIFTHGATDGLNRIANMLNLKSDDVVIVSNIDHHSARLPFEKLARQGRCKIEVCPLTENMDIDFKWLQQRIGRGGVRAAVITMMSNVIGRAQQLPQLDTFTILDCAQYVVHSDTDVKKLDCDALVFSAHKIYGGTGLGILYLKNPELFESDFIGGGTVSKVYDHDWELVSGVERFEAGTLPLVQISGLPAALKYSKESREYVANLTQKLYSKISELPNIEMISKPESSLVSFNINGVSALDVGAKLGVSKICVRAGTHCASWIHNVLDINGSVRISLGAWNDETDVENISDKIKGICNV